MNGPKIFESKKTIASLSVYLIYTPAFAFQLITKPGINQPLSISPSFLPSEKYISPILERNYSPMYPQTFVWDCLPFQGLSYLFVAIVLTFMLLLRMMFSLLYHLTFKKNSNAGLCNILYYNSALNISSLHSSV